MVATKTKSKSRKTVSSNGRKSVSSNGRKAVSTNGRKPAKKKRPATTRKPRRPKYQLLPPLSPEEYAALRADIAARGIQVPVDVDDNGAILDGHSRTQIAEELGIKHYPIRVVSGLTEQQKRHHVLTSNLNRRHLSRKQKREIVAQELKRSPSITDNWLAELTGVDHKTVGALRRRLVANREIPNLTRFKARNGKVYRARSIIAQTAIDAKRAQEALRELNGEAPNKPLTLRRAEELVRRQRWVPRGKLLKRPSLNGITLHHCDFRDLKVRRGGVKLIFTDPPYQQRHLSLWDDLGKFAKRVLAADGLLVAYSGIEYLPTVMNSLGKHLRYQWTHALIFDGDRSVHFQMNVANSWRPLLIYAKKKAKFPICFRDVFFNNKREKEYHEYQQNLSAASHYIDVLTKRTNLICDPFGGSFTTAVAAAQLGRKFVGCDIDERCVAMGYERLAEVAAKRKAKAKKRKTR